MFDRYVAQTKPSWKRRGWIIASVGLHIGVLVAMMIYMLLHIEEITPPALSLTFFSAAPPPPPPPPPPKASSTPKQTPKVEHKIETPKTMVQPTDVKPIVQPKEEKVEEKDDGEEGGEEGGVKGGVAGGVKGGVVGGQVGGQVGGVGTGGGGPVAQPKTVPQFVLSASKLNAPDPHLPTWFTNQHAGQTVRGTYRICIRQDGSISDVFTIAGLPGADAAVIDHVKSQWKFKPQGLPVCAPWVFMFKIN